MRVRLPLAVAPFLAHAIAREVDRALGLVLRAEVEPAGVPRELTRALGADGAGALTRLALWLAAWAAICVALEWRRRREGPAVEEASGKASVVAGALLLRPAVTLLALLSVGLRPSYPSAFTLPVALT